ncbi:MAG: NUDIX hydrolase [Gemmatimonadaceae bacterium]
MRGKRQPYSVDVVALTPQGGQLAILLRHSETQDRWELPWDLVRVEEGLEEAAQRTLKQSSESAPTWRHQVGAFADGGDHPSESQLSVAFVALIPLGAGESPGDESEWFLLGDMPHVYQRQQLIAKDAVTAVRDRLDLYPVAFKLLPSAFTLSELQQMYELLLDRRLHKASFRRALQAAWLVEPTDEWRSEGRGRPAQLYRYSPKRRRRGRRGVRFDLLG